MTRILIINPNTSQRTTEMMVAAGQLAAPDGVKVIGATARSGPAIVTTEALLAAAGAEVLALGKIHAHAVDAIVIGGFGDPGIDLLRAAVPLPVTALAEAGLLEAAAGGRRFGIATITANLNAAMTARVTVLGLSEYFTGLRLTPGDPAELTADPARLLDALAAAVAASIAQDGAEAVIIGGGPLTEAAAALARRFPQPIIAPVPAAIRRAVAMLRPKV